MDRPTEGPSPGVSSDRTGKIIQKTRPAILFAILFSACVTPASPMPPPPETQACKPCPVCPSAQTAAPDTPKKPSVFPYGLSIEAVRQAIPGSFSMDLHPGESEQSGFERLLRVLAIRVIDSLRIPPSHYQGAFATVLRTLFELFSDGRTHLRGSGRLKITVLPSGAQQFTFHIKGKHYELAVDFLRADLVKWDSSLINSEIK
ncbi:hypothetical protein HZA43_03425 [Candidatus Peregrinibacteria bacterium]|nr:hypothetical protein [Candidatus Peregrinibacteria bacterium]